jgi:hypothetical protein
VSYVGSSSILFDSSSAVDNFQSDNEHFESRLVLGTNM